VDATFFSAGNPEPRGYSGSALASRPRAVRRLACRNSREANTDSDSYQLDEEILNATEAGALGYLLKSASQGEVIEAILAVHQGNRRVPAALAMRLAEHMAAPGSRGQEVLVVDELTNKEIVQALGISEIRWPASIGWTAAAESSESSRISVGFQIPFG